MTQVGIPQEALETVWHLEQEPQSVERLRHVAGLPPDLVAACLERGWLHKPKAWGVPELTDAGREALRAWRKCWDCGQECTESTHKCPARARGRQPYRDGAQPPPQDSAGSTKSAIDSWLVFGLAVVLQAMSAGFGSLAYENHFDGLIGVSACFGCASLSVGAMVTLVKSRVSLEDVWRRRWALTAVAVSILFVLAYFKWAPFREASDFLYDDTPTRPSGFTDDVLR